MISAPTNKQVCLRSHAPPASDGIKPRLSCTSAQTQHLIDPHLPPLVRISPQVQHAGHRRDHPEPDLHRHGPQDREQPLPRLPLHQLPGARHQGQPRQHCAPRTGLWRRGERCRVQFLICLLRVYHGLWIPGVVCWRLASNKGVGVVTGRPASFANAFPCGHSSACSPRRSLCPGDVHG